MLGFLFSWMVLGRAADWWGESREEDGSILWPWRAVSFIRQQSCLQVVAWYVCEKRCFVLYFVEGISFVTISEEIGSHDGACSFLFLRVCWVFLFLLECCFLGRVGLSTATYRYR